MANGHGGKRLNSGRKPDVRKYMGPDTARELLEQLNWANEIPRLYAAAPAREQFAILNRLADYAFGKPAQQKEQPKTEKDDRARVVVQFWEDADISKPAQMGPVNENVTVRENDTHDGSSDGSGSSLGPSGKDGSSDGGKSSNNSPDTIQ